MPTHDEIDREQHGINQTRESHLQAVLVDFNLNRWMISEVGCVRDPPARFLLVERVVNNPDALWWTDHATETLVWQYRADENVDDHWTVVALVDLDTGERLSTSPPPEPVASNVEAPGGVSGDLGMLMEMFADIPDLGEALRLLGPAERALLIRLNDLAPGAVEIRQYLAEVTTRHSRVDAAADLPLCLVCNHTEDEHHHGPNEDECECGCSYFRGRGATDG